mgnify:CR=1 FL=1
MNGMAVTVILVLVSLAVRYFFVSNSAFVASFYPVLFSLAVNTKANPMVVGLLLAFFASFGALLTHYGTEPAYNLCVGLCAPEGLLESGHHHGGNGPCYFLFDWPSLLETHWSLVRYPEVVEC